MARIGELQKYIDTNNISAVVAEQRAILREYRKDASKYDKANKLKIECVLDLISEELRKENKRFFISDLQKGGRFERFEDNFGCISCRETPRSGFGNSGVGSHDLLVAGASEIVWKQLGTTGKNNLFYSRATARHYQMWAFSPTNPKVVFKKLTLK